ncbi:MAG: hypothetical protein DDT20_01162 [Firmicutes bacterium]|nr:hypothetical protein [Bacillota bacterium]
MLLRYLGDKVPYLQDLAVLNMLNLNDGWECEVYSFELRFMDKGLRQSRPMILRMYTGQEVPLLGSKAMREFNTLRQLSCAGFPVPQVYLLECDQVHLGSPFIIMEKIEGERLDHLCAAGSPAEREKLFGEMCELFVSLHNLHWRCFEEQELEAPQAVQREIERHRELAIYAQAEYTLPALAWLEERASTVAEGALALAYWDYHSSNIIIDSDGNAYVFDWAGAYVTDHRFASLGARCFSPRRSPRDLWSCRAAVRKAGCGL